MNASWTRTWLTVVTITAIARAQSTDCASLSFSQATGASRGVSISADGRFVAFRSDASNLVPNDTNGKSDVFVFDRENETIERVSVATGGTQGNDDSGFESSFESQPVAGAGLVAISADGRYVVFPSKATNLVTGDTNGFVDVFVRDRQAGTTERVSVSSSLVQGDGNSGINSVAISPDGRYVAFDSYASNLVTGDTNSAVDAFLHDRQTGITERVSVGQGGAQGDGDSSWVSMTPDGRFVAFASASDNLVLGDANMFADVFLRDRQNGTTEIVSVATDGTQGNDGSLSTSISADGRYVAFHSYASNLYAGDTNGNSDIFLRDRQTGTTELIYAGTTLEVCAFPGVTPDGRYVVFEDFGTSFVAVGVRDRQTGSLQFPGIGGTAPASYVPDTTSTTGISADGRFVVYSSDVTSIAPNDTNGVRDIFVHDFQIGSNERVSGTETIGNSLSTQASISGDGLHVTYDGPSTNLVTGDTNGFYDVFAYDRTTATVERVSVANDGSQANGPSFVSSVSSDGRYVAFDSNATNLVASDVNGTDYDVFVRDRVGHTTQLISVSSGGAQGNDVSRAPAISDDGRFVAFWSNATNLVAGDTNGRPDIFVRDRQAGTTEIASVATGGALENNSPFYPPAISADGRYVAFLSYATNLVANDTNGSVDVFVHDRQTGTTERVSVDSNGVQGNSDCYAPVAISSDGRYVTFASDATNLVTGDTNNATDVFLRDRQNGTTVRVSLGAGGLQANGGSDSPTISADGRYVAFMSDATNLVTGDTNGLTDIFLHDCIAGTTERSSRATDGTQGNGASSAPSLSSDGRDVAFESGSTNFVAIDTNHAGDVFVHDRGAAASDFASFCAGDGTGAACPCTNSGAPGHGCENSSTTGGALLTASGVASLAADTVSLTSSGEKPTVTSVLLQGTSVVSPIHYGDGLRCVGGTLKRLYSHNAVGGIVTMPQGTDVSISAASAAKGDVIAPGSTRGYQIYYRDPSATFCPSPNGSTFNISSAILVAWGS